MKLRYYLRGLGIGMVVTALLMGVALKDRQSLSDAEIRVRAMELGMVEGDSRTLADIQNSQEPGVPSPEVSAPVATPEATTEPTATPAAETATPTPTASPNPTATPEPTPLKPLPMVTPKPSPTPESVTFVISSGQSSYTVSKALVEAGLVEDASVFDQYLEDNGYSKRISTGTYEIPLDSTQEEIAKIITRSR